MKHPGLLLLSVFLFGCQSPPVLVQEECDQWKRGMEAEVMKEKYELDEVFYNEETNKCFYAAVVEHEEGRNYQVINVMQEANVFDEFGCFESDESCRAVNDVEMDFIQFVEELR